MGLFNEVWSGKYSPNYSLMHNYNCAIGQSLTQVKVFCHDT